MIIKSLELSNFRNYDRLNISFLKGINVLYGDNAQGKTNVLEGIFVCGTTKSHRGSKDRDMIQIGQDESHLRIFFEKKGIHHKIDMHLKKNKSKGIAIDGIPIRKSSELIGFMNVVFFSPEDLSIIKNGPGERRRFMDMELCQLDKVYLYNLTKYNKIINQRNNLLRQIGFNKELMDTLSIWNIQLMEYGKKIISARENFVNELNDIIYKIHKKLSGGKEDLKIKYEPNVTVSSFENQLNHSLERDIHLKMTNVGPHRDDICLLIGEIDIRKYGSQGQQRTSALSLKLSEIEMVKKMIKDQPILLLDDVLSELDRKRQNYLLESIDNIQTIITCTGLEEFIHNNILMSQIYHVKESKVEYTDYY